MVGSLMKYAINHISFGVFSNPLPSNFTFIDCWGEEESNGNTLIGPNNAIMGEFAQFSIEELVAAKDGSMHLYIWGWIDYNDVFENTLRHRSEL